jgi:hypothetical protein
LFVAPDSSALTPYNHTPITHEKIATTSNQRVPSGHFCDVALDTEIFNGHTTSRSAPHIIALLLLTPSSEMLWMGLPLISAINSTQPFGRVTAGLLKSSSISQPLPSPSPPRSPWQPVRAAAQSAFPQVALPPSALLARDINEYDTHCIASHGR